MLCCGDGSNIDSGCESGGLWKLYVCGFGKNLGGGSLGFNDWKGLKELKYPVLVWTKNKFEGCRACVSIWLSSISIFDT